LIEPTRVKVRIETVPVAAEVWRRGKLLGRTPFVLELEVEKGAVSVELRSRGYRSVVKRIDATDDMTIKETLTRAPRGGTKVPGSGSGKGSGSGSAKTGSGDTLLSPDDI
jgi:hypothetical protein